MFLKDLYFCIFSIDVMDHGDTMSPLFPEHGLYLWIILFYKKHKRFIDYNPQNETLRLFNLYSGTLNGLHFLSF